MDPFVRSRLPPCAFCERRRPVSAVLCWDVCDRCAPALRQKIALIACEGVLVIVFLLVAARASLR